MSRVNTAAALALLVSVGIQGCASPPVLPSDSERQALAPSGTLRVAFLANSAPHARVESGTGRFKGPTIELGEELARRLGRKFEPRPYGSVRALVDSIDRGEWDVIATGVNADLQSRLNFAPPHARIALSYIVRDAAPIRSIADADRPGVRIVVLENGNSDVLLTRSLRHASLLRVASVEAALRLVRSGEADAHANLKTALYEMAREFEGSRVLDGEFHVQPIALAVARGDPQALAYLRRFIGDAKANGLVRQAIDAAGVSGLEAAP